MRPADGGPERARRFLFHGHESISIVIGAPAIVSKHPVFDQFVDRGLPLRKVIPPHADFNSASVSLGVISNRKVLNRLPNLSLVVAPCFAIRTEQRWLIAELD